METLYILKCNEFYKIGIANDLESRLAQLQTGNPYELVVEASFEFPNAGFVERALHQRFAGVRKRGEWFELKTGEMADLFSACRALGGVETHVSIELGQGEIEEAEEIQQAVVEHGEAWDFAQMFRDGWRMEQSSSKGVSDKYWAWRRGQNGTRQYIYGGKIEDLPFPNLEEMRRIFRDGKTYQPYIRELGSE